MECVRCFFTDKEARMNGAHCEYCDLHDELEKQTEKVYWPHVLEKIQKQKSKYHCLIGVSGGLDSSVMLYLAVRRWNLNPLVIHFDNFWNAPEAESNIDLLVRELGVDFIRYSVDMSEYDDICRAFLLSGVPDADIPNDMAMAYFMYKTAMDMKIKYIFNGHNFRTEGSSPSAWSYMDAKYLCSVYGEKPYSFPLQTIGMQLKSFLKVKQVRPLYYVPDSLFEGVTERLFEMGWEDYGGKHCENVYTEFVGSYLLPRKFNIDKRRTYASALIRSGKAQKKDFDFSKYPEFSDAKLYAIAKRLNVNIAEIMGQPPQSRDGYAKYNFRRYKPLLWVAMKLGIIPLTFYRKYTK